jgi:hypothetical protein
MLGTGYTCVVAVWNVFYIQNERVWFGHLEGAQPVPHADFESQRVPKTVRPYLVGPGPPFPADAERRKGSGYLWYVETDTTLGFPGQVRRLSASQPIGKAPLSPPAKATRTAPLVAC